jgi:hypothetical protein
MRNLITFDEYLIIESVITEDDTLYSDGNTDAVKGTGYADADKANQTVRIIDKLKKTDHRHAMAIATTMSNRAKYHKHRTSDMEKAAKIFDEWIDKNRKT